MTLVPPRLRPSVALAAAIAAMLLGAVVGAPVDAQTTAQTNAQTSAGERQRSGQGGIRIGVIDMQKIMSEAEAVQSIQRQIDAQRKQYQSELQRKEKELREANEALARERSVLSQDAFQQKRRRLEEQVTELQREIQQSKRRLDENYSQAMRKVQDELVGIVREMASKRDLDMILGKATVVIVRPRLDLTERALERLNAALSSVDVAPLEE
jgi:Skp family chaperone for outer membrane proteins